MHYISFFAVIGVFGMAFGIAYGCLNASRKLHCELLTKILRAPMSFFDTTPIGRSMRQGDNCFYFGSFLVSQSQYHPKYFTSCKHFKQKQWQKQTSSLTTRRVGIRYITLIVFLFLFLGRILNRFL